MASHTEELREMALDDLDLRLAQRKQELFNLRFQLVTGQLDNSTRVGQVRREVARILTIQREREIADAEALEAAESGAPAPEPAPIGRKAARAARRAAVATAKESAAVAEPAPADNDAADDEIEQESSDV
jgi:large subunit ribosomal protein L29